MQKFIFNKNASTYAQKLQNTSCINTSKNFYLQKLTRVQAHLSLKAY